MYPSPDQEQKLARLFGCVRTVFNDAVSARETAREQGLPYPTRAELSKSLTLAKQTPERVWLGEVSAVPLQQALSDAERAYTNFFRSISGTRKGSKVRAPRFKSRRDPLQTARFTRNSGFSVADGWKNTGRRGGRLYLPKVGDLQISWSRKLPSDPSSVTVIRERDGRYFVSFVVDARPTPAPYATQAAGIDLGLNHLVTIAYSDGTSEKVDNPRYMRKELRKLARAQKEHARRAKGSANREKSRAKIASIHRRIRESRQDHHHKLARRIVDENQVISLETLGISGLGRTRLAKSIHDAGWGILIRLIEEKAHESGRTVVRSARDFPSTRLCSVCGTIGEKKPLHVRSWKCECGATHDRDVNAAVNLLNVAAGHAETKNACRGNVRPDSSGSARRSRNRPSPTALPRRLDSRPDIPAGRMSTTHTTGGACRAEAGTA